MAQYSIENTEIHSYIPFDKNFVKATFFSKEVTCWKINVLFVSACKELFSRKIGKKTAVVILEKNREIDFT